MIQALEAPLKAPRFIKSNPERAVSDIKDALGCSREENEDEGKKKMLRIIFESPFLSHLRGFIKSAWFT